MKITNCPLKSVNNLYEIVLCPGCRSPVCRKHGFYLRKGFHTQKYGTPIIIVVPRYRCLNPECPRCTFSVLPPMVMRYCRFFWPCLIALYQTLAGGATPYHLARYVWHVGREVILRAATLLRRLCPWVERLYREITDGNAARDTASMVKAVTAKIGRLELVERWYRHRYPLRFG
jgi:hypothetical protein